MLCKNHIFQAEKINLISAYFKTFSETFYLIKYLPIHNYQSTVKSLYIVSFIGKMLKFNCCKVLTFH